MKTSLAAAGIVIALGMSTGAHAQNAALRVGAAKVDVTPVPTELPKNYEGILDHIYSRAIVIDNGTASAALISVDAGGISDPIWQAVSRQLETDLGIPAKNVLLSATHSHSVPNQPAGSYAQKIVESVRLAKQRLEPARIGYGTGVSYINVNRNIIDPKTRRWWEGPNYEKIVCGRLDRNRFRNIRSLCPERSTPRGRGQSGCDSGTRGSAEEL